MKRDRIRGFCPRCRHQQIFQRVHIQHGLHLFLSVVTLGLWLVSWLSIYIGCRVRPWRCVQCNWHRPIFDRSLGVEGQAQKNPEKAQSSDPSIRTTGSDL